MGNWDRDREEQRRAERRESMGRREQNGDEPETLSIKAFGITLITSGRNVIVAVLAITALSFLFWAGWVHHTEMLAWEQRSEQQLSELIYILSLPQGKREELNIAMPATLRAKINRGRPND